MSAKHSSAAASAARSPKSLAAKGLAAVLAFAFAFCASALAPTFAAVPLRWAVETSRVQPAVFDAYHGEEIALEAALQSYGKPVSIPLETPVNLYWQTNGMGSVYWSTNATVSFCASPLASATTTTVFRAFFRPEFDPGAAALTGFIGSPESSYRAAFTLRFRNSPGASPQSLPLPTHTIDFATVNVQNAPYYTKDQADNRFQTNGNYQAAIDDLDAIRSGPERKADAAIGYVREHIFTNSVFGGEHSIRIRYNDINTPTTVLRVLLDGVQIGTSASTTYPSGTFKNQTAEWTCYYQIQGNAAIRFICEFTSGTPSDYIMQGFSASSGNVTEYYESVDESLARYVPTTRLINGQPLSSDVTIETMPDNAVILVSESGKLFTKEGTQITASAVGAKASSYTAPVSSVNNQTGAVVLDAASVGAVPTTRTVNNKALSSDISLTASDVGAVPTSRKINGQALTSDITIQGMTDNAAVLDSGILKTYGNSTAITAANVGAVPTTRTVNGKALSANVTLSASDVNAYPASSGNTLATQVNAIGAHLNAEDAHFVSTNYDSEVHMPEAYVEINVTDENTGSNSWIVIWREMTRWNRFLGSDFEFSDYWDDGGGGFYEWMQAKNSEIDDLYDSKAEKCWGTYDSETGGDSPNGILQISTPQIYIANGMAYQRTLSHGNAIWVLTCNHGHTVLGGDTNGVFRISDSEGNVHFEIVKGDKVELGADADGIEVNTSTGVLTVDYSVVANDHPTIETSLDLDTWKGESDSDSYFTVSWTGSSGAYVATLTPKATYASAFVRATYTAGGETYIRNNSPVSMDSIMLNGTKYYLGTATINGNTVLTLSTTR